MNTTRVSRPRVIVFPLVAVAAVAAVAATAIAVCGCNDSPTTAVVENGYPLSDDAGSGAGGGGATMTVFKAWWVTTLFPFAVGPAATSETERTIPGTDFAYALLAPGWSPDGGGAPGRLIAIKSTRKLSVAAHERLRITVSDDQFAGNCAAGSSLAPEDAALIVERIFPGDFAGVTYDPATCASTPIAPGSNADASTGDAAAEVDADVDADVDAAADDATD